MPSNGVQPGGKGVPAFPNTDGFDLGADAEELARYAAFRGNLLGPGTTAERNAFPYPYEGLRWANTSTGRVDAYRDGSWGPDVKAVSARIRKGGGQTGISENFTNVLSLTLTNAPAGRYRIDATAATYSSSVATHNKSVRVGGTAGTVSSGTPLDGAGDWIQNWPANVHCKQTDTWFWDHSGGDLRVHLDVAISTGTTRAAHDACRLAAQFLGPV